MAYKRKAVRLRKRQGNGNCLARMKRNGLVEKIYMLLPNETAAEFRMRLHRQLDAEEANRKSG